jgi:hypothetical protein
MSKVEIREETVTRRRGVLRLARMVGRNHGHISRVLSGERDAGPELAQMLKKLGVRVPPSRKGARTLPT